MVPSARQCLYLNRINSRKRSDLAATAWRSNAKQSLPSQTFYVSLSGLDTNIGAQTAPFRTIAKAVSATSAGGTIILMDAGQYEVDALSKTNDRWITIRGADGLTRDQVVVRAAAGKSRILANVSRLGWQRLSFDLTADYYYDHAAKEVWFDDVRW